MHPIEGTISRILFHRTGRSSSGLPFLIASVATAGQFITIKGEMAKPARGTIVGERFRFYGEFRPDSRRDGETVFAFDHYEELIPPGADGIEEYLYRHIAGLGKAHARRIVDSLGPDTIHQLRTDPDAIDRVAGLPARLPETVKRHFAEELEFDPDAYARLSDMLADQKFPRRLIVQLLRDFGSSAPQVITDNPYLLMDYPGVGWERADAFGTSVVGYALHGIEREVAALTEALTKIQADGHTVAPHSVVETLAAGLLKHRPAAAAWAEAVARGRLAVARGDLDDIRSDTLVAPARLHAAEQAIAWRIGELRSAAAAQPIEIPGGPDLAGLTPTQATGVQTVLAHGFALLVGGPGTGKTTTTARLIACLIDAGITSIRFLGPTGKAAKRGEELIRRMIGTRASVVRCSTIHRALGIGIGDDDLGVPQGSAKPRRGRAHFGFLHNQSHPMSGDVFIVDELSLLDTSLASSLFDAIPLGALVLLVGDPDQLPSVGPGAVLRDLLASDLPTVVLTDILRSDGGGTVVRACHAIKAGRLPEPAARLTVADGGPDNWMHVEADDPATIAATIRDLVAKVARGSKLGLDPMWDVQVVAAQIRTPEHINCDALNTILGGVLNRVPEDAAHKDLPFRPGDKVIRTKNKEVDGMFPCVSDGDHPNWRWDETTWTFRPVGIVNGDQGLVKDVVLTAHGDWVVVEFRNPVRLVRLTVGAAHLKRAYAITAHASQGSGYSYVIVPVHDSYFYDERTNKGLWCRELIYTSMSRAESVLVTVGQRAAINTACRRQTLHVRATRLVEHMRAAAAARAAALPGAVPALRDARATGRVVTARVVVGTLQGALPAPHQPVGCKLALPGPTAVTASVATASVAPPDADVVDVEFDDCLADGEAAGEADEPVNVLADLHFPLVKAGVAMPTGDVFDDCGFPVPF